MKEQSEFCEHLPDASLRGSAASRRYAVRLSPLTTVIAASVLTIVLVMGLGWQVRQSYLGHKYTQKQAFPISRLRGRIIHFDEVLTMSANMAAATGDPQWEKRYREVEPQLDVAIKSLKKLVPETFDSAAAIQTDEANIKLVEMENQVFELVGQGRLDEAQAILSGDDYCEQKALYSDGMERIGADLKNYITANLESNRKRALVAIVSVVLGLPLLALIWLWVLRNMRRHLKERGQAERALRESEERFRSLVGNIPGAVYRCQTTYPWPVEHISEAVFEITGYRAENLLEGKIQGIGALIVAEDVEDVKRLVAAGVAAHRPFEVKYRIQHAAGGIRWVHKKGQAIYDADARPLWLDGVILDITESKLVEEQVENLARFPSENPSPVLRIARDGTLLYANDASEWILEEWGCRKGEAVPDEWCEIISGVFDTGQGKKIEREYAGRVFSFMIAPVIEAGYANLYCRDTTDRKRAEELLKLRFDLEELLTSISTEFISLEPDEIDDGIERALESIIDAVCVDRGYIFLYSANGETMDNTHERCRPGVPPHKGRLQNVPVERFAWFNARMKRFETVAVDSVAGLTEEAEAEKKEWLYEDIQSLLCVPMIFQDRLMGFVGFDTVLYETEWAEEIVTFLRIVGTVFANALDRKQAGQERERLLKTLAAKNEELQSIVYVASHDLKSPLVNIHGFSGELGKTCEQIDEVLHGEEVPADIQKQLAPLLDEDIPESIGFIRAGTAKMQALLNGLLEVCRIGSAALEIRALDMNEMMNYIIATMQFQITDSGAELTVDDLPGCIGDPDHVNQVFSNLLTNAVKYLDPDRKGDIHVSGRVEAGQSIYCVRDNGLGIAPQHQQKVFEIFHRLEPDRHEGGEGLGLTIALRIIERHEGRIWVESEQGKGSKFFVSGTVGVIRKLHKDRTVEAFGEVCTDGSAGAGEGAD